MVRVILERRNMSVSTPYRPTFVDELKELIPFNFRYWNPNDKTWHVSYKYQNELYEILTNHFGDYEVIDERNNQKEEDPWGFDDTKSSSSRSVNHSQSTDPYSVLFLLPSAPKELVDAVYKTLAKLEHPDVSKNPNANKRMVEINNAYDKIISYDRYKR